MEHKIIVVNDYLLAIGDKYMSDKFPYLVAEKLTTGFFHLFTVHGPNDWDTLNQYQILAHRPISSNVPHLEGIDLLPASALRENIYIIARNEILNYLTGGNPDGDFVHSTIGAEDKILWWSKGYKKGQETHPITKDIIKPLQELLNEGYDPYDSAHHLQVQKMLKVIEQFISNLKLDI